MEICAVINLYSGYKAMKGAKAEHKPTKMSRDQRSRWSREQDENSNAIDRFLWVANSLVISVVF